MRKVFFAFVYVGLSLFAVIYAVTSVISSSSKALNSIEYSENKNNYIFDVSQPVKLLSFNLAHGRKQAFNQIILSKVEIKNNLKEIAAFLKKENPTFVALQEADAVSFWSQSFNHVKYLALHSGFRFSAHGTHVDGAGIQYGTAILSQIKPNSAYSFTFNPSPPTFSKGFTVMTLPWPGTDNKLVDIISVHLDYSRESVRNEQLQDLADYVISKKWPFIIMGDFNIDWSKNVDKFEQFKRLAAISTYQITNKSLVTFPSTHSRIDWIFVSADLSIKSHQIIKNNLSDHYAITAEVDFIVK